MRVKKARKRRRRDIFVASLSTFVCMCTVYIKITTDMWCKKFVIKPEVLCGVLTLCVSIMTKLTNSCHIPVIQMYALTFVPLYNDTLRC